MILGGGVFLGRKDAENGLKGNGRKTDGGMGHVMEGNKKNQE